MIKPSGTLGILGGGQLGRMIALAARPLGYRVVVMDPSADCAAKPVVEEVIVGEFDDAGAAARLAERADAVTIEIEKIGVGALEAVSSRVPLRPSVSVLSMIRDRGKQKRWLENNGAPIGPWRLAEEPSALHQALTELPGKCFVKSCTGGYDGRGQVETESAAEAERAVCDLHGEMGSGC
ncbi:MAG: ATP-grasp domain-containing protein [Myxococcota bacterium]